MGVVVFDADVLIGFLNVDDAQHAESVAWMHEALTPGTDRLICAVNYSEVLVGPLRHGKQEIVRRMLVRYAISTIDVDDALAERAAAVRARTNLRLPDAYALATAIHSETRGHSAVRLATFDKVVLRAHAELRRNEPGV